MAKRQHVKNKDRTVQEKLDMINRSTERKEMPRPAVFKDKSKFDRNRQKQQFRRECFT